MFKMFWLEKFGCRVGPMPGLHDYASRDKKSNMMKLICLKESGQI